MCPPRDSSPLVSESLRAETTILRPATTMATCGLVCRCAHGQTCALCRRFCLDATYRRPASWSRGCSSGGCHQARGCIPVSRVFKVGLKHARQCAQTFRCDPSRILRNAVSGRCHARRACGRTRESDIARAARHPPAPKSKFKVPMLTVTCSRYANARDGTLRRKTSAPGRGGLRGRSKRPSFDRGFGVPASEVPVKPWRRGLLHFEGAYTARR